MQRLGVDRLFLAFQIFINLKRNFLCFNQSYTNLCCVLGSGQITIFSHLFQSSTVIQCHTG